MPPLPQRSVDLPGRQVLRQQQGDGGEHAFRCIVKILVLTEVLPLRVDDGLGQDLGILLRLGPGGQISRISPACVHVMVDQGE